MKLEAIDVFKDFINKHPDDIIFLNYDGHSEFCPAGLFCRGCKSKKVCDDAKYKVAPTLDKNQIKTIHNDYPEYFI